LNCSFCPKIEDIIAIKILKPDHYSRQRFISLDKYFEKCIGTEQFLFAIDTVLFDLKIFIR